MSPTERLARSLLLYAARSAPPALSERLAEEWLADFEARGGGWARLRHALGCCWATTIIAREHGAVTVAAAAPAGAGALTRYGPPDSPLFSRRALALGLIACLHVGLIWALANGVLQRMIDPAPPKSLQAEFLPPVARTSPPLPPGPTLQPTILHMPPIIDVLPPPPGDTGGIETTLIEPPASPPSHGTAQAMQRVQGGPGRGFPNTADYYPPEAIRLNEQGSTGVSVCVNEAGRLTSAPTIAQSSGSARLDAGALKLARAGSGHYQPTTEDARPVSSCYSFRIRFALP
jgi:TonB family protein